MNVVSALLLAAIQVTVDPAAGVVHVKREGNASKDLPIPIEKSRIDGPAAKVDVVPIGDGKTVVHVRVPDAGRKDLAFEAVFVTARQRSLDAAAEGKYRAHLPTRRTTVRPPRRNAHRAARSPARRRPGETGRER